jgi:hypothetical protein
MLKLMSLPLAVLLVAGPIGHDVAAHPAIGHAIDNTLNHNLPFIELSYSSSGSAGIADWTTSSEYSWRYPQFGNDNTSISFTYYDQMTTQQRVQADSNNGFATAFGWVGGLVANALVTTAAVALADSAAPVITGAAEATKLTQAGSALAGAFAGWVSDVTGYASAAGSY